MKKIILLVLLITCVSFAQINPVQNGDLYSFTFGNIYFEVTAAQGGKVTSLQIDTDEMIYTPSPIPQDYTWGGTVWIAPESEQPYPNRHPAIDQGAYTPEINGNILKLTSGIDTDNKGNQFQLVKEFYIDETDNSIVSRYTLTNKGTTEIRKSIWELTRIQQQGLSFWSKGENPPVGKPSIPDLSGEVIEQNNHYWMPFNTSIAGYRKFYSDVGEGWIAHADNNNHLFIKSFEKLKREDVVVGETVLEYWLDVDHLHFEYENVSRAYTLQQDESFTYEVKWFLSEIPQGTDTSLGSQDLIDLVRSIVPQESLSSNEVSVNTEKVKVYPNPADDKLFISLPSTSGEICIYNLTGKIILNQKVSHGDVIDISSLTSGMYIYKITVGNNSINRKLIIK